MKRSRKKESIPFDSYYKYGTVLFLVFFVIFILTSQSDLPYKGLLQFIFLSYSIVFLLIPLIYSSFIKKEVYFLNIWETKLTGGPAILAGIGGILALIYAVLKFFS